ncbi:MAG: SDR family oxidoreductase [Proteobacteria bacterium]|nr:SDR family oxidoreductase [Pseudomonadota bacterium]
MTQVVIITGASSGIGRALSVELTIRNYKVIGIDNDLLGLEQTRKSAQHQRFVSIHCDLSRPFLLQEMLSHFNNEMTIDYIIHCATVLDDPQIINHAEVQLKIANFLSYNLKRYCTPSSRMLLIGSPAGEIKEIPVGHLNTGITPPKPIIKYDPLISYHSYIDKSAIAHMQSQPSLPLVAKFAADILQKSKIEDFSGIKWDYRNKEHHNLLNDNPNKSTQQKAKL